MTKMIFCIILVLVFTWFVFVTGARKMRALRVRRDRDWQKEYGFCRHCGSKCLRTVIHDGYDHETGKERTHTSDDCIEGCY